MKRKRGPRRENNNGRKKMKDFILTAAGVVGGFISWLVGGWNAALTTLVIFMAIDFISGLIVAGVFKGSKKTESGALSSKVGFKGICKKCMILLFVLIGAQLDIVLHVNIVRDGVCVAFILNELISIVENAGLMGVPIPAVIQKALDMLQKKNDKASNAPTEDTVVFLVDEDDDEYDDEDDDEEDEEDEEGDEDDME